jgi:hypothetical protein
MTMARFGAMALAGVMSLVLAKMLLGFLIPLIAAMVGIFVIGVKIALFALVAYFVYRLFRGRSREAETTI